MSFESLLEHFYTTTGIEFNDNKPIINKKVERFYLDKGYNDYHDFFAAIKQDSSLHQELINLLTTSETYFYRELSQIKLFLELVKDAKLKIKILCVPCASGEEPYSILISMLEENIDLNRIEIYGIDINSDEIDKAKKGRFSSRRLHQLPPGLKEKYFISHENGEHEIIPKLQRHIHFKQMNLFEPFPQNFSSFDVIFSRNMLIYFDRSAQEKSERIFYEKLKKGGFLFLGHADHIYGVCDFKKVSKNRVIYYKKQLT